MRREKREKIKENIEKKEQGNNFLGMKLGSELPFYAALILSVALYVFTKNSLFGVLVFVLLIYLFLKDALPKKYDAKEIKHAIFELLIAFFAALAAWMLLGFFLQTSTPIDVVTSCSMLPNLERGDMIIIQGGKVNAEEIAVTAPQLKFIRQNCKIRNIRSGEETAALCTVGVSADGKSYFFNESGDIIVYEPKSAGNLGLIVHRVIMKMKYNGKTYYITKGDNNVIADVEGIIQMPPTDEEVKGKMIARIPYLGYLKLFLFGQFAEPEGCDRNVMK